MRRSTSRDASDRATLGITRGTLESVDSGQMMQAATVNLLHDEQASGVEHFEPYGFTAVPFKKAEVLTASLGGSRSHSVVFAVSDRRHRPTDMKPGESALHDDQGQRVHLTRDGIVITGGDGKRSVTIKTGQATITTADDKTTIDVGGMKIFVTKDRIDLGGEGGSAVQTQAGPSTKVFAVR